MCEYTEPSNGLSGHWQCVSPHTGVLTDTHVMKFRRYPIVIFTQAVICGMLVASTVLFWIGSVVYLAGRVDE